MKLKLNLKLRVTIYGDLLTVEHKSVQKHDFIVSHKTILNEKLAVR